jgi:hypothetical protein
MPLAVQPISLQVIVLIISVARHKRPFTQCQDNFHFHLRTKWLLFKPDRTGDTTDQYKTMEYFSQFIQKSQCMMQDTNCLKQKIMTNEMFI